MTALPAPLITSGDPTWPVWLVAEAPGAEEIAAGRPLVGLSGQELDRMLSEAGFPRPDRLYRTNVCHESPPSYFKNGKAIHNDIGQFFSSATAARSNGFSLVQGRYCHPAVRDGLQRLHAQIEEFRPRLIIELGGTALWGCSAREGITKWRGSVLHTVGGGPTKAVCTYHPADVLRQWTHRQVVVQDLRRALRESAYPEIRIPPWQFVVAPSVSDVEQWLRPLIASRTPLICDTEGWGVVDCIGFASSALDAICIPFVHQTGTSTHYWNDPEDELRVFALCVEALRTCPITFHNALWDCQVIARRWGVMPNLHNDTMVMQHVAFPGLLGGKIDPVTGAVDKKGSSLSLSFIASMYCDYYRFWKDDGRHFDPAIGDERDYWRYNCEDCVRTFECGASLERTLDHLHLTDQYRFEMSLFPNVFRMMFDGIGLNPTTVHENRLRVNTLLASEQSWLEGALGYAINPRSSHQMQALFYDDLRCQPIRDRKTGNRTLNDNALETIARRTPLLLPLVRKVQNIRTLGALGARDTDTAERGLIAACELAGDRLRSALNIAFVETMRFSSNQTAFGEGCNLQNLPRPPEDD